MLGQARDAARPLNTASEQTTEAITPIQVPYPSFDPNDTEAAARHRELVRAASANSNRAQNAAQQNDFLIQEARNQAMGLKHPTTSKAQVQTAQQVGELAAVTGKPKAISHAAMKAQVAQEMKDPNA